jgi:2'-5' RNA ligase
MRILKSVKIILINLLALKSFADVEASVKSLPVKQAIKVPFVSHEKEHYLSQSLDFKIFEPYFLDLNKYTSQVLKNRGEAHITVITPPEFESAEGDLGQFVSMAEINEIAQKFKLQETPFKIICLGRGLHEEKDQKMETYFIVLQSKAALKVREQVAKLYKKRGGQKFNPHHFYPHITLGFSHRDLHEKDGVIKNKESCLK